MCLCLCVYVCSASHGWREKRNEGREVAAHVPRCTNVRNGKTRERVGGRVRAKETTASHTSVLRTFGVETTHSVYLLQNKKKK